MTDINNNDYEELILDVKAKLDLLMKTLDAESLNASKNKSNAESSIRCNLNYSQDSNGKNVARDLADYIEQSTIVNSYSLVAFKLSDIITHIDQQMNTIKRTNIKK